MAVNKKGEHIKGTKKELPEGWTTSAFRFALFPTSDQQNLLEGSFGCERKVYNEYISGLYEYLESIHFTGGYIKYNVPNYTTITQRFPFLDKTNDSFVYNDAKVRFQVAIKKYNDSYAKKPMMYKKSVRKKMKTINYVPTFRDIKGLPKFHSKKQGKFSYTTNQTNGNIRLMQENGEFLLRVPKFPEGIPMILHRDFPSQSVIKKATIKREGTQYVVSISVDHPFEKKELISRVKPEKIAALDYSQQELFVDQDGHTAGYPRYHKIIEKRQRRLNKSLARKKNKAAVDQNGNILYSKNYQKEVIHYQKVMTKAKNQRKDFLHKKSNQITNDYDATVVEGLDLSNLAQCLSLGKKLHDNGFGMFRQMLKYKSERKGKHYIVADKYFASSKICSECGHKKDTLKLSERVYVCEHCHTKIDRDYNAGRNLKKYGMNVLRDLGVLDESTVCNLSLFSQ